MFTVCRAPAQQFAAGSGSPAQLQSAVRAALALVDIGDSVNEPTHGHTALSGAQRRLQFRCAQTRVAVSTTESNEGFSAQQNSGADRTTADRTEPPRTGPNHR